jgi:hypothetical protein
MSFKKMILVKFDEYKELINKKNNDIQKIQNDKNMNKKLKINEILHLNENNNINEDELNKSNIDKTNENIKLILNSNMTKKQKVLLINKNIDLLNILNNKNSDIKLESPNNILETKTYPTIVENLMIDDDRPINENSSNNLLSDNNQDHINKYNSKLKKSLALINKPNFNIIRNKKRKNNEIQVLNNDFNNIPAKVIIIDKKNKTLSKTKINTNLNEIKDSINLDNDYDDDETTFDQGSFVRSGTFPLNSKSKLLTRNQITGWSKF